MKRDFGPGSAGPGERIERATPGMSGGGRESIEEEEPEVMAEG